MARNGRPRLSEPAAVIIIKLRLRAERDDDLLAFFASLPPRRRASAVKLALRTGGLGRGAVADDRRAEELDAALDALFI